MEASARAFRAIFTFAWATSNAACAIVSSRGLAAPVFTSGLIFSRSEAVLRSSACRAARSFSKSVGSICASRSPSATSWPSRTGNATSGPATWDARSTTWLARTLPGKWRYWTATVDLTTIVFKGRICSGSGSGSSGSRRKATATMPATSSTRPTTTPTRLDVFVFSAMAATCSIGIGSHRAPHRGGEIRRSLNHRA